MPSRPRGFSLIDVVVGIALMLIVFLSLSGLLRASLTVSSLAKAKAAAIEVANTQIEYLRGLSYDSLGTVGGIPSGPVPQTAVSTVDGVPYTTRTFIEYIDDPADGTGGSDSTGVTTDYKLAKVDVSYSLQGILKSVSLISNFAPPGIESSTGGGTLSIHTVNAAGANLSDVAVHIVNIATSPTIDFTTFSNSDGYAIIGGAATSSEYRIFVSSPGYSSAQTYARDATNVNPTPGYLTVVKDQTTGSTFSIDLLSTLVLSSFSPAVTTTFSDSFDDASELATQTNVAVSGGTLTFAGDSLSGSARSVVIAPTALSGWGLLSASISTDNDTSAVVQVDDASGTLLPDSALSGNSIGFTSFPVSLTGLSVAAYPALTLSAALTRNSTSTTAALLSWSLSHTDGPLPLANAGFTLTGAKTIGTTASSASIYKTIVTDTTGSTGMKSKSLEWDGYSLALTSGTLLESCPTTPYSLFPASTTPVSIIIGTPGANTLPVVVNDSSSAPIGGARVVLTKSDYAATITTSACGFAYFNSLSAGTYTATASAAGHATTSSTISVSGQTAPATLTLP